MSRKKHRRSQQKKTAETVLKQAGGVETRSADPMKPDKRAHSSRTKARRNLVQFGLLIIGAVLLAILVFFFIEVRPMLRLRNEIPPVPDLSGRTESFIKELEARDKSVRGFRINGDKVGELGTIYQANLCTKEAEKCYEIAARLSPRNPRWPYYLAYLRQQQGMVEGADALLSRVIALSPQYLPAQLKSADLYFKAGKPAEAREIYLRLVDDKAVGPYANLGLARIHQDAGKWDDAKSSLERALRLDPGFKSAYRMLATVYDHAGNKEESEIFRERAGIERFAEAPDPWIEELAELCFDPKELMRLANIALQTSKHERAFNLYKKAVELEPENVENILQVGQMVFDSGNREAALPLFQKALALRPGDEMALFYIGLTYYFENRLDEAGQAFRKLIEVNPRSADGWTGLGDIEFRRQNYQAAEENFKKALASDSQSSKTHYALGRVEAAKGRSDAALRYFQKAADLDPRSADALFSIGAILAGRGKTEEAMSFYKKALGENPDFALAHYNLANALFRLGKFDEAKERYRRVIDCDPEIAEAHLNLGTLLEREGRRGEALEHLKKALSLARSQGNIELEQTINTLIVRLE